MTSGAATRRPSRRSSSSARRLAPAGYPSLAGHFDRPNGVTYDPRGTRAKHRARPVRPRSPPRSGRRTSTASSRRSAGPVDVFASSGGAVNGLALDREIPGRRPDSWSLTSRRSPRSCRIGSTRSPRRTRINETYMRSGFGRGDGPLHRGREPQRPIHRRDRRGAAAGPRDVRHADGGRRQPDRPDARAQHALAGQLRARLRRAPRAPTRLVLAAGVESDGTLASRGAFAVAERLGKRGRPLSRRPRRRSWAASTASARRARTTRPSPRSSARCSRADLCQPAQCIGRPPMAGAANSGALIQAREPGSEDRLEFDVHRRPTCRRPPSARTCGRTAAWPRRNPRRRSPGTNQRRARRCCRSAFRVAALAGSP